MPWIEYYKTLWCVDRKCDEEPIMEVCVKCLDELTESTRSERIKK